MNKESKVKIEMRKKRWMAVLLSAVLIVGMMSGAVPERIYAQTTEEVRYSTDGGSTWTESSLMDALWESEVTGGDNVQIELLRDITLVGNSGGNWADYQQMIGTKNGSTWTIDGKGHTITRGAGCKGLFVTMGSSTITLKNITVDGGAKWSSDDPATRTNSGISLSANAHLFWVYNNATLILDSGVTLQNSDISDVGGAVKVGHDSKGTLVIKDGVTIKGNRAKHGGAIYVDDSDSKVTMEGGRIYGNQATGYGGAMLSFGTVEMNGGKIDNNQTLEGAGGGVIVYDGSMVLSGSPVIAENVDKNGAPNNVFLNGGRTISISSPLTEGAKVGVMTNVKQDTPIAVTGTNTADYSEYFFSDAEKYRVENSADDDIVQLMLKTQITPELSLPGSMVIHTDSDTDPSELVLDEVKKEAEISGIDGLVEDQDYTLAASYNADENKSALEFRLTEEGKKKYYIASGAATKQECTVDIHRWETEWSKDENSHWKECACGEKSDVTAHSYGPWTETKPATEEEEGQKERSCTECGYEQTKTIPKAEHKHTYGAKWSKDENNHWKECACGEKSEKAAHTEDGGTVTKRPTETEDGVKTYKCNVCGYVMRTETIDKTGGGTETPDTGILTIDTEQGTNAPDTDFGTSKGDLIRAVLTTEEQNSIEEGIDVKIVLAIHDIDDSVSEADKQLVTDKAGNDTVGEYLDISLFKVIGSSRTIVPQTNGKIKIVITIPDGLKNTDTGKVRTYSIVRVHDGAAEILSDLDDVDDTITIETDKFSTYALVYHDTAQSAGDDNNKGNNDNNSNNNNNNNSNNNNNNNSNNNNNNNDNNDSNGNSNSNGDNSSDDSSKKSNGKSSNSKNRNGKDKSSGKSSANTAKDNEPKTGETTPIEMYATLSMVAGFSWLLLYFGDRKRGMTEQKKKEITASIIAWGRKGGKLRKMAAIALIFVVLVYYHSIGKRISVDWKEAYED